MADSKINNMIAIKSILFFILAPGTVAGLIPLMFFRNGSGIFSYLAFPLWVSGFATLVWCFWDFVQKGKGTPAPFDPPKELVVAGLYQYVRNPMYVGVFLINLGYFVWFGYWNLLFYLLLYFVAVHSFVTFYEEPHLKKTFGTSYEEYMKKTPRWIPRFW
jgi:protein-S-isoprenylcysteine O-methyltransferase Ste14